MAWRNSCLSLIAAGLITSGLLATACGGGASPLDKAALSLKSVGTYRIEYDLATYFEGTEKPVLASGQIDFNGPDRWHLHQGTLEMIGSGSTTYVRSDRGWRVEELVELPIHPLLYLKAAQDVRRTGNSQGALSYSFSVDRETYGLALAQAMKAVSPVLGRVVGRFHGEGEIAVDGSGLPKLMHLRLTDSSVGTGKTRQDLDIRFLEFGGNYEMPEPVDTWAVALVGEDR